MYGSLNGYTFNGAATPNWVVRAVVVAVAAATFSVSPLRTSYGAVQANASVNVSLVDTRQIAAYATATGGATSALFPHMVYNGHVDAQATTTGTGAILNYSFASAGGDATCTGLALTSQAIGDASNTAESTVADCIPHIVFSARSLVTGQATGQATGDVTRYPTVQSSLGEAIFSRAEARYAAADSGYYLDDGYVLAGSAIGRSTASVPQAGMLVTAHFVAFDVSRCNATVDTFIRYTTRATGLSSSNAQSVRATQTFFRTASSTAAASAVASAQRTTRTSSTSVSGATAYGQVGRIKHASEATGVAATASSTPAQSKYTGIGSALAMANAELVSTTFGNQLFGGCNYSGSSTGYPAYANQRYAVAASGQATASRVSADYAMQYREFVTGTAISNSSAVKYLSNFSCRSNATGTAQGVRAIFGTQHQAGVLAQATASASNVVYQSRFAALASGTGAANGVQSYFGIQHKATGSASASASSFPVASFTNFAGRVSATAAAQCMQAYKGTQYHATAVASAAANAPGVNGLYLFYSGATGIGSAQCLRATPARQYYEFVTAQSEAAGVYLSALQKFSAHAFGSGVGLVAHITAIANSDTKAPDERYMIVGSDDRVMVVQYEDRMMVVA